MNAFGRAILAALLVGLLALPLAGCGKDSISLETAAEAADATSRSGSFRMSIDMSIDAPSIGEIHTTGSGEMDVKRKRTSMVMDFGSIAQQAGAPDELSGLKFEMVLADLVMYMKVPKGLPGAEEELGRGKNWVKIDLREAGRQTGVNLDELVQQMNSSPDRVLDQLKAVSGEMEKLGTEKVRGVDTTRYRTNVDVHKLADVVPESLRPLMRKETKQMVEDLGGSTFPLELWIDEDNLLRRERAFMTIHEDDEKVATTWTAELFDFGADVDIEPPPEDETHDLTDELPGGFGG